ncbi:MAG: class I SAM-dependent methyltransferase [Verrucomicrobiota bacterium]|nr:class I SAM-dependent methyltransferase [Verrucomicrobiota bacterium]
MTAPNTYSSRWFESFHVGIAETRTEKEVAFICAWAPQPQFRKVLDICCGMGRHARALAQRGYAVTGIERDPAAIARARELGGGPVYVEADVQVYQPGTENYDLAIVMSQSFGHFDAAANRDLLQRLANGIRDGGRIILDLWNPDFFAAHQGERSLQTPSGLVHETKRVEDDRLFVRLDYPGGGQDDFEWQLFTVPEMGATAGSVRLHLTIACTDFEAASKPSPENPRIQFVLQK